VSCSGLTPGARYTVWCPGAYTTVYLLGTFTVESSGNLNVGGKVEFRGGIEVWVVREDGTPVLVGTMP
jgi:hypothetical protein